MCDRRLSFGLFRDGANRKLNSFLNMWLNVIIKETCVPRPTFKNCVILNEILFAHVLSIIWIAANGSFFILLSKTLTNWNGMLCVRRQADCCTMSVQIVDSMWFDWKTKWNGMKRRNKQTTDDQMEKWRNESINKSVDKMVHNTKWCQVSYYCIK